MLLLKPLKVVKLGQVVRAVFNVTIGWRGQELPNDAPEGRSFIILWGTVIDLRMMYGIVRGMVVRMVMHLMLVMIVMQMLM